MTFRELISVLLFAAAFIVVLTLIYDERDPSTTLAWTLALMLLPGVGLVAYLLVGRNWRTQGRREARRLAAANPNTPLLSHYYQRWSEGARTHLETLPPYVARLASAIQRQNGTQPLPCTNLEIFTDGARKFESLIADIEAASHSIHLEYFIWECDELTARVCDALGEAAQRGVEVRVLYDWLGSLPFGKDQLKQLARAGAWVQADARQSDKLNYRNHRKIAVIDGMYGYTGGMNMGAEYVDGGSRYAAWRDTHCRFGGPLVAELQRMFCGRWYRVTGENLLSADHFPSLEPGEGEALVWSQVVYSGAESQFQAIRNTYLLALTSASRVIRVQSPYFVPDEAIAEALNAQALAGVDLRLMMTGVPDKRIAWFAAFSYIDELIEAGGRLLQYDAGFFHPKTMTIDGEVAVIGTTNFDIRSFALHDELSLFFYDRGVAEQLDRIFDQDKQACHEVTEETYREFTSAMRFRNALARVWSRLL